MAENELEVRLNKKIVQLQSRINSLAAASKRLHGQITHPSALARIKTYVDKPIASIESNVTALQSMFEVWIDYSAISTIVGWSAFTNKKLEYKLIDDIMFVSVFIEGTSDDITVSFSLPNNANDSWDIKCLHCKDNSLWRAVNGTLTITASSNIINCFLDGDYSTWADSNTKSIQGQFFFRIA